MKDESNALYALEKTNFDYLNQYHVQKAKKPFSINNILKKLIIHLKIKMNKSLYTNLSKKPDDYCWNHDEWLNYLSPNRKKKIVIYTCITGGYDKILDPYFLSENIDYVSFTDQAVNSKIWEYRPIPEHLENYDQRDINRYIKMHPSEFFEDYDYSIYIDGNVKVISDLSGMIKAVNDKLGVGMHLHVERNCIYKEGIICQLFKKGDYQAINKQLKKYREEKFPENYGMCECTIIITDIKNRHAKKILDDWWVEYYSSLSKRDQLALPYVLWKEGITIEEIGTLGRNLYKNPKFRVNTH